MLEEKLHFLKDWTVEDSKVTIKSQEITLSSSSSSSSSPSSSLLLFFKVHPGKGSAVLFYNLLEDGNGDDLALHAALPVKQGEKWLANFWVLLLLSISSLSISLLITYIINTNSYRFGSKNFIRHSSIYAAIGRGEVDLNARLPMNNPNKGSAISSSSSYHFTCS